MSVIQERSEPVFVNVYGAQESIPPAYVAWRAGPICWESIPGLLKRLTNTGAKTKFSPKILENQDQNKLNLNFFWSPNVANP